MNEQAGYFKQNGYRKYRENINWNVTRMNQSDEDFEVVLSERNNTNSSAVVFKNIQRKGEGIKQCREGQNKQMISEF